MNLRKLMPATATRIDWMRKRLGVDVADEMIQRAMKGEPGYFFSAENLRTFGTEDTRTVHEVFEDDDGKTKRRDPRWMVEGVEFSLTLGIEIVINNDQDDEEARQRAEVIRDLYSAHRVDNIVRA